MCGFVGTGNWIRGGKCIEVKFCNLNERVDFPELLPGP